jgi:hypothetical protein
VPLHQRLPAALLAAALGAVIVAIGLPRAVAALWEALQDPVMRAVEHVEPVTPAELRALEASRRLALAWVPAARRHADRATALLALAHAQSPDDPTADPRFEEALAEIEAGLALGPADPVGWARLASLRLLAGAPDGALAALRLSLATGAHVPAETRLGRIETGLALERLGQGAALRLAIDGEIRLLWAQAPDLVRERAEADASLLARLAVRERLSVVESPLPDPTPEP